MPTLKQALTSPEFDSLLLTSLHSVGDQYCFARWRPSSSSVTLHGEPAGSFTLIGQAVTSCRLQSDYSSMVTLRGKPVVLRPVSVTPCSI